MFFEENPAPHRQVSWKGRITRASFCCSNKARKLHLFSAKVAFMRTFDCERLETTYFACKNRKSCEKWHAKIEKVAKVACKNRKSCKKLHANIEKVAKSCNTKFLETAQNIELYISWVFRKLLEAVKKSCKSCKNLP